MVNCALVTLALRHWRVSHMMLTIMIMILTMRWTVMAATTLWRSWKGLPASMTLAPQYSLLQWIVINWWWLMYLAYIIFGWSGVIAQIPINSRKTTCCKWASSQSVTKTSSQPSHSKSSMMHRCLTWNANLRHINITRSSSALLLLYFQMPLRYETVTTCGNHLPCNC